ncbi:MAG: TlpA family protein disulfide reductase [Ignavibacteria bacterium]|nr:TlpA family protein disulfide reductase [Ignavibacteria bacterium]MBI3766176.1 TlpA family protein disulfide reductase [Ignavibacteriales bacterium]
MGIRSIIFLLAALFMLSSGCMKKAEEDQPRQEKVSPLHSNVAEVLDVTKRPDVVPNFTWKDSAGKIIDFDSFKGKVTLINFWATWCGPCKRELPDLVALSTELAPRNIKILGVSTDRGTNAVEDVRTFVKEHGLTYQNVIANADLEEAFGNIRAIPTSFLIDAQGKITQTIVGLRSKEFYAQAMLALAN